MREREVGERIERVACEREGELEREGGERG